MSSYVTTDVLNQTMADFYLYVLLLLFNDFHTFCCRIYTCHKSIVSKAPCNELLSSILFLKFMDSLFSSWTTRNR